MSEKLLWNQGELLMRELSQEDAHRWRELILRQAQDRRLVEKNFALIPL
jgi:hypothetical protein